jgi:hypothetical protein
VLKKTLQTPYALRGGGYTKACHQYYCHDRQSVNMMSGKMILAGEDILPIMAKL